VLCLRGGTEDDLLADWGILTDCASVAASANGETRLAGSSAFCWGAAWGGSFVVNQYSGCMHVSHTQPGTGLPFAYEPDGLEGLGGPVDPLYSLEGGEMFDEVAFYLEDFVAPRQDGDGQVRRDGVCCGHGVCRAVALSLMGCGGGKGCSGRLLNHR
jgi:hypothetical protein